MIMCFISDQWKRAVWSNAYYPEQAEQKAETSMNKANRERGKLEHDKYMSKWHR